jgi:hypothetical protein
MIINALIFNANWFGLILLGNKFIPVTVATLLWHFYQSTERKQEFMLFGFVITTGVVCDTVLTNMGVFLFEERHLFIPLWLAFIWASFAVTINHSLSFLKNRPLIQALFAGVGAPMSYIAGQKFGVVDFGYSHTITFVVLGLLWIGLFRLFTSASRSWEATYANH